MDILTMQPFHIGQALCLRTNYIATPLKYDSGTCELQMRYAVAMRSALCN